MMYKILKLYDKFHEQIKDDYEHDKCLDNICSYTHDILKYLENMPYGIDKESVIFTKAVDGMNSINDYCDKFGCERVFDFDASDIKTVMRNASDYSKSITEYSLSHSI